MTGCKKICIAAKVGIVSTNSSIQYKKFRTVILKWIAKVVNCKNKIFCLLFDAQLCFMMYIETPVSHFIIKAIEFHTYSTNFFAAISFFCSI